MEERCRAGRVGRVRRLVGALVLGGTALVVAPSAPARPASVYTPPPCPAFTYHTAPHLHAGRVCMNNGVTTHGTPPGTYLFLTQGSKGAGIFRDNGQLVWWLPVHGPSGGKNPLTLSGDYNLEVVNFRGRPYLAVYTGAYGHGEVALYDSRYRRAGVVGAAGMLKANAVDLHEFKITPQNDALIGSYYPIRVPGQTALVLEYVVQKLSLVSDAKGIHTGKVLFQWRSYKSGDVRLSQSYVSPQKGAWDYFHGNAIDQDTDGNLLVSARNTWGIYKINATPKSKGYGHVIWEVGAKGDSTLPTVPWLPWCYQHAIAPLGNNQYSLYDDGGIGPGCGVPGVVQHPARGVIFSVDPSSHPAGVQLVREYTHVPPITTNFTGSMQVVSNNDALVDWGDVPQVTEYPHGSTATNTNPNMDLSLSAFSYRGLRFAWIGRPTNRPAVAVRIAKHGVWVWASWNGSTELASWRVLGGRDAAHLKLVSGRVASTGFETTMFVAHSGTLEVQALDSSGRLLRTSAPVAAG